MPLFRPQSRHGAPRLRRSSSLSRPRRLELESLEERAVLAAATVFYEFAETSAPTTPLTTLQVNRDYLLRVLVQDTRAGSAAEGIAQGYFDISYSAPLLTVTNSFTHPTPYNIRPLGSATTDGLIDSAGGRAGLGQGNAKVLLFSVPIRTDAVGTLNLTSAVDEGSNNKVEFFLNTTPVTDIEFVGSTIAITATGTTGSVNVTPTTGLVTTEAGGTATFNVSLSQQPSANVTIGLSSSNTNEGTVSAPSLTFTSANWNIPQTVTITGVNDNGVDGNVSYSIITAAATSTDAAFNGVNGADVSVTNQDNDTAGITVSPTSGLTTTEAGGTATFTIVLNSQPTNNVTIGLSSSNTAEGTVSPTSIVFTPAGWNVPRTITVTGVDDNVFDGNLAYTIITAAATSADANYNGRNAADVSVANVDNDVPGVVLTPSTGLVTTESGGTATFTIRLSSQPSADVSIGLTSNNTAEGTVDRSSVTFTTVNWNTPQTVTVTGVDDSTVDGNVAYSVVTGAAVSTDPNYSGRVIADVSVTNQDNEAAGFTITPLTGLVTTEAGGTATFNVSLTQQPTGNVTLGLTSSNTNEGTVSAPSLTFTSANWNIPQTVTITGVNDNGVDGNVNYSIVTAAATSADANFNGVNPADVSVTNQDNDTAGITVSPTTGLTTMEAGGTATFTIVLNSQPTNNVTIGLSSSNTAEGTVAPTSIVFTPAGWNTPRTITITGVDDNVVDGAIAYTIITAAATSADANYNGRNAADVSVSNTDNDTPSVIVTPTTGLTTTEGGGTATFTLRLATQPTADVTIGLTSNNTAEGTIDRSSVTFTTVNWNTPQTVTVTGVDDANVDGNVAYSIVTGAAVSTDSNYSGRVVADVSATNQDNDTAGVTITPLTGLTTTEAGGTATFTIRLNAQPAANVTIPLSSSNAAEGTVAPASVVFTNINWNVPQTVTITGVDDAVDDGNANYSIVTAAATSTDAAYNGFNPADVAVTNTDDETAAIVVTPTTGLITTEAAGTATFTVRLASQPTANVTIGLTSSNTAEGTVGPASLIFTAANWNTPQTVTITGVDDAIDDGNIAYSIVTAAATSTDTTYNGLNGADVSVSNQDNDDAGISVTPTTGLVTTEAAGTATFIVRLNSQPTANVTIGLTSDDTTEGTVAPASLIFTNVNWNVPQTVTITGVNDALSDGNIAYSIVTAAATSTDAKYNGLDPADVAVVNQDDDAIAITVTKSTDGSEAGSTAGGFVVRISQPVTFETRVQYTITGTATAGSDYTALTGLAIIPANTTTVALPVTVVDDPALEGSETVVVTLTTIVASAPDVMIDTVANVATVNIADNETGRVTLAATTNGSETGPAAAVFTITQNGITPEATVLSFTLAGTATAGADYTAPAATVTIPAGSTSATVTIPVLQDAIVEAAETLAATIAITSGNTNLTLAQADSTATATITDNDSAMISVSSITQGNETGPVAAKFTIRQSAVSSLDTVINYRLSGTAASGSDFTPVTGSATIPAGQTSADVVINVLDDATVEAVESIILTIDSVSGAQLVTIDAAQDNATLEVLDNNSATVSVAAGVAGNEAGPVNGTFVVTMTSPSSTDTIVAYTAAGTATSGSDYTALSGTVTIPAGQTTATITVNVIDDARFEGVETVTVKLTSITGNTAITIAAAQDNASLNIADDETGLISIAATTPGNENGPVTGVLTVTQDGVTTTDTVVTYTIGGTATAGTDYTALTGTVTIPAGQTKATISAAVLGDEVVEGTETVIVTLTAIQAGQTGLALSTNGNPATLNILDDDTATVSIEKTTDGTEANTVAGTFTIRLSKVAAVDTVVTIAYTGTTTSGDYSAAPATATIPAGQLSAVVTITPVDDNIVEATETVIATLSGISSAAQGVTIPTATKSATLEIADNDSATATIAAGTTAAEGGAAGTFVVTLSDPSSTTTTIAYTFAGTAISGSDYTALSGTVTIPAGETSATINIAAINDTAVEGTESVALTLTSITTGDPQITLGNTLTATLNITDNDSATVAFVTATSSALEMDGTQTIRVVLNIPGGGTLAKAVTVNVSTAGGSAGTADYTLTTTSVTFAAGSANGATRDVKLNIINDTVVETTPETAILALAIGTDGTGGRVSVGTPNRHTLTITDDTFNASLAGRVWLDADANNVRTAVELGVPNVTIRLTGTDRTGASVSRTAVTDGNGAFAFRDMAGGTYTLEQVQPTALLNGGSFRGTVGTSAAGTAGINRVTNIVLPVAATGSEFNFSELGLQAQYVNARSFTVSALKSSAVLGSIVAAAQARTTAATTATTVPATTSIASTQLRIAAPTTTGDLPTIEETPVAEETTSSAVVETPTESAQVSDETSFVPVTTSLAAIRSAARIAARRLAAQTPVVQATPATETVIEPTAEVQFIEPVVEVPPVEEFVPEPVVEVPSNLADASGEAPAITTNAAVSRVAPKAAVKRVPHRPVVTKTIVPPPPVIAAINEPAELPPPAAETPVEIAPPVIEPVAESSTAVPAAAIELSNEVSESAALSDDDLLRLILSGANTDDDAAAFVPSVESTESIVSAPTAPVLAVDQLMETEDWNSPEL